MNSKELETPSTIPVCPTCLPHVKSGKINQLADGDLIKCPGCRCDIPGRQYRWIVASRRQKLLEQEHNVWKERKERIDRATHCARCMSDLVPSLITGELVCTHCQGGSVRKSKMTRGAK